MLKQKIYIVTTLFNYYFDTERAGHPATVALFKDIKARKYEAFTSFYVTDELDDAPIDKRDKMIAIIKEYGLVVLDKSEKAERIADICRSRSDAG